MPRLRYQRVGRGWPPLRAAGGGHAGMQSIGRVRPRPPASRWWPPPRRSGVDEAGGHLPGLQPVQRVVAEHQGSSGGGVGGHAVGAGGGDGAPGSVDRAPGPWVEQVVALHATAGPAPDHGAGRGQPAGLRPTSSSVAPSGRSLIAIGHSVRSCPGTTETSPPRLTSTPVPVSSATLCATRSLAQALAVAPRSSATSGGRSTRSPSIASARHASRTGGAVTWPDARPCWRTSPRSASYPRETRPAQARVDQPVGLLGDAHRNVERGDEQRVHLGPAPGSAVHAGQVTVLPEPAAGAVHLGEHVAGDGRGSREQGVVLDDEVHVGAQRGPGHVLGHVRSGPGGRSRRGRVVVGRRSSGRRSLRLRVGARRRR